MLIILIIFLLSVVLITALYLSHNKEGYQGGVSTDFKTLASYARDISIFTKTPTEVYYPRTVDDVVTLIKKTAQLKTNDSNRSLTVRAGGTCMSGGPLTTSAVIDMTRYMTGIKIDVANQTATVEAGVYFRDVEKEAAKHGLMFAPYPSSRLICGIGGMIGNNASGEKSIRYGATSDNIEAMEIVLADGTMILANPKELSKVTDAHEKAILEIAKQHSVNLRNATGEVRKAASGYRFEKILSGETFNLVPLFCGAQGTLGIVTKAVLKLVPIPEHLSLIVISAKKLEDIPIIVDEIFKWNPEAIETFDKNTFAMARKHLAVHADKTLPYVDAEAELFILAEFSEKTKEETEGKAKGCFEILREKGYFAKTVSDSKDISSIWEVRRNSFLLMRDHNGEGFKAVPCIEDVVVPVSALAEFIDSLHKILDRRGIKYGFHGHIGEGSLRIVPVFNISSPTLMADITGLMEEVFSLIKHLHGNISADHSDGIIRSPFLREFYGEELYNAFVDIKNIYDPLNIMNPGKKIGVEVGDIEKYFDRK